MNGIDGLAEALRTGRKRMRENAEQKAQRGVIEDGRVRIGARSYPMKAAVDADTSDGSRVWVLIARDGTAVIIGA